MGLARPLYSGSTCVVDDSSRDVLVLEASPAVQELVDQGLREAGRRVLAPVSLEALVEVVAASVER
jgi:hypothetical protein